MLVHRVRIDDEKALIATQESVDCCGVVHGRVAEQHVPRGRDDDEESSAALERVERVEHATQRRWVELRRHSHAQAIGEDELERLRRLHALGPGRDLRDGLYELRVSLSSSSSRCRGLRAWLPSLPLQRPFPVRHRCFLDTDLRRRLRTGQATLAPLLNSLRPLIPRCSRHVLRVAQATGHARTVLVERVQSSRQRVTNHVAQGSAPCSPASSRQRTTRLLRPRSVYEPLVAP